MQLNRMVSRIRLIRPYRLTTAHSRVYLQPRLASSSSKQIRSNLDQANPLKIETKLDKVLGDKSAEVPRAAGSGYTGDQFIDRKEGSGTFASTSSSSSDSSDRSSSSSSSSVPSGSFGSSSSSSNERSPSYDKFSNERVGDNRTSGANFSDRTSQSSGSQFQPQSQQSSYGGRSSSSEGFSGSRSADDRSSFGSNFSGSDRGSYSGSRQSNDFGSDNRSSGRGGGSFGEMASKMADKVSDTFSGGSGTFSQTMNKMADKVSDKLSGNSNRSSEDRSSSSSGGDSSRTSTTSSAYSGNSGSPAYEGRSYESDRGEGGRSFAESGRSSESGGGSFGRMTDRAADRVSSAAERVSEGARSGIGETLHKISDKISETFSGSRSSGDNAESRMMRSSPRRGRDSLFNPFDLSSIFRGNFFDNFSDNSMRTDIVERDSDYRVICDMPGVDKRNINITLNNNRLEIYGERNDSYDEKDPDQTVHRQERYFGSYTRQLLLPEDASQDMSNIKAKCENGVLTVTIPKSQHSSRDRYNINIE